MANLSQLKKKKGSNLKKLQEKLEQSNQGGRPRDERIWKPTFDPRKGKGTAIVRFLTPQEGDPFVEVKSYSFQGPGGNYFDIARQTAGEEDPIQIASIHAFRKAKNEGDARLKEQAKKWLPRSVYHANVLVIKDEEHPENEGKVKIFQFGRQIYGLIEKAIQPEFDDVDPLDPFDFWEGADFKIRMIGKEIPDSRDANKKVMVPNYENSEFDRPSSLFDGDDDQIDTVFQQTIDLSEFISADKIKSFDAVAARFEEVTGKPYDWLTEAGAQKHVDKKEKERDLSNEQDNDTGVDNHREKEEPEGDDAPPFDGGDEVPDDEDPIARFQRLANKGK